MSSFPNSSSLNYCYASSVLFCDWIFSRSMTILRFIHYIACIINVFIFIAEQNSIEWVCHDLRIHSFDEYVHCCQFQLLRVKLYEILHELVISLQQVSKIGMAELHSKFILIFRKLPNCFSNKSHCFRLPPGSMQVWVVVYTHQHVLLTIFFFLVLSIFYHCYLWQDSACHSSNITRNSFLLRHMNVCSKCQPYNVKTRRPGLREVQQERLQKPLLL